MRCGLLITYQSIICRDADDVEYLSDLGVEFLFRPIVYFIGYFVLQCQFGGMIRRQIDNRNAWKGKQAHFKALEENKRSRGHFGCNSFSIF